MLAELEKARNIVCPKRVRFSTKARGILHSWMQAHIHDPYPTDEEKEVLRQKTGLTARQINTWFTNARVRGMGTAGTASKENKSAASAGGTRKKRRPLPTTKAKAKAKAIPATVATKRTAYGSASVQRALSPKAQ